MYNIVVNKVPKEIWMNEKGLKVIDNFNDHAEATKARLVLSMHNEPETREHLESMLEEGMYDFQYPSSNPYSDELKAMIEEADNNARFIYFETSDLLL